MKIDSAESLRKFSVIFWDFDGVIKDSVDAKTKAYESLFMPYGQEVASRVRQHHESNGGVSRFEKVPLYLTWAGENASRSNVQEFCDLFSASVKQAVIDSPWVPGVREYLLRHFSEQYFVLVTATPQSEIEQILSVLQLSCCFREIYGAPTKKSNAIKFVMSHLECSQSKALMVGDSETDLEAASINSVPFLLRCSSLNASLQSSYSGPMFDHLNYE